MIETTVKLSIIIISFNTRDLTCQCLSSVYSAIWDFPYEIILVDNNSQDDTLEHVQKKFPEVKIIANNDNKFFAIANNQGAAISQGEYLLLLNSDTIVEEDNLCRLVHFMERLPEKVVCVGPEIRNIDNTVQSQGFPLTHWVDIASNLFITKILPDYLILRLLPDGTPLHRPICRKVGWVSGCCMLIRANYYHSTGGLNEQLFFYGEEPEFAYRAAKKKKEIWYYPDAHIVHLGGASTNVEILDRIEGKALLAEIRLTNGLLSALIISLSLIVINIVKYMFTFRSKYSNLVKTHTRAVSLYLKNMQLSDLGWRR